MRKIKFRVWNPHSKDMSNKYHAIRCNGVLMSACSNEVYLETDLEVTKDVVMQFTGLLDKNGKEIYEGDIVESYNSSFLEKEDSLEKVKTKTVIEWENSINHISFGLGFTAHDIEIIGNIYENSDLIK